jgi:RND family efflux transporter MFP subunit
MKKMKSTFVVLVATAGCGRPASPPALEAPGGPPRAVVTVAVEPAAPEAATVPATVLARERAALAARASGSVVALPYREGEAVRQGAVVARIEGRALRSGLEAAETEKTVAELDLARTETLLGRGAATPQEADQARARAAAARSAVASARDVLGYAELRSPFTGRVSARPARVGDIVMPGAVILEIEGAGLEVVATVDAADASRVRPGTQVDAEVDGQPAPLTAVVRAVAEAGDPATHRVLLRADLPAAEGLRSGLFARLRLPGSARAPSDDSRLIVPASALVRRGGLTGVFVVREGRARLRWIAAGEAGGRAVEVRAGLERGERVVREPAGLSDGTLVREG